MMSNHLKQERKLAVLEALTEGCSVRSTERLTGVHRDTILRLLVKLGTGCERLLDDTMKGLELEELQVDELWTFVKKKQGRLKGREVARLDVGTQFVFIAIDRYTKLVPCYAIGKRTEEVAGAFLLDLRNRVRTACPGLTTDGWTPFPDLVDASFGANVNYEIQIKDYGVGAAQQHRFAPPRVKGIARTRVQGQPQNPSTSHVERHNHTVRQKCRRFTRLTNAFSKKLENLKAAVALYMAHYNFCWIPRTLGITPAMAAGVSDHVWDSEELLQCACAA